MDLSRRSPLTELMDTEAVDAADFARCLADLATVNRVTLAHRPTLAWLAAATRELPRGASFRLLDVASGHGDMLRAIARWARARGLRPVLEGLDLNPHSAPAARAATPPGLDIAYHTGNVFEHRPQTPPDFIVSSLFTHHLGDADVVRFLRWMDATARRGWFVNDLHRHAVSYRGFAALAAAMRWHRFVRHDGPVSILRAFRPPEWQALLAQAGVRAQVRRVFPFRLCVGHLREPA